MLSNSRRIIEMIESVLLVDDDPDIRWIGELALSRVAGWKIFVAPSGEEALKVAQVSSPDVILLDVMMPRMDGPATLEALRANKATALIPVIFCTAKAQRHEVEHFRSLGAVGVIAKPFDPMTLAQQVSDLVAAAV